jgi:hypothetical protein
MIGVPIISPSIIQMRTAMARHVMFVMHGIGQRAPEGAANKPKEAAANWSTQVVDLLIALAQKYQPGIDVSRNPAPNGIRIVPLAYCDIIVRELEAWASSGSQDVAKAVGERFPDIGAGRLAQLEGISQDDAQAFWDGPVDVLLYRLFLDGDIRAQVRDQIAQALVASSVGGQMPTCSFVCHSMGTAVLHDTLAEILANPQMFGGFANMDIHLYASLANVSKVLQSQFNPNESPVRPLGTPSAARFPASVRTFVNAHNFVDPVAHIGMFRPKWDPNTCDFVDVEVDRLKWIDVHSFIHYLENPSVHIPILRAAFQIAIDAPTEQKAIKAWEKSKGDNCPEALEALRERAVELKDAWDKKGDSFGPVDVVVSLVDVWRAIEDARAACGV